ncbi:hypothetical protein Q767_15450, partial [Flavobacterium enshiense DK69]
MKKLYFLLMAFCLFTSVNAQIINFPDANFKARLMLSGTGPIIAKNLSGVSFKIDANNNGEIEVSEAQQVSYLNLNCNCYPNQIINSISGISNFINLNTLQCANHN